MKKISDNKRIRYTQKILQYSSNRNRIFGLIGCKLFAILLSVSLPLFYNIFIVKVLTEKQIVWFAAVAAGYLGIYILQSINAVINTRLFTSFTVDIKRKIKKQMFSTLFSIKRKDFVKRNVGDLKNNLENDIESIDSILNVHCLDYYYQIIYAVIVLAIMLSLNWILTLVSVVMIPFSFLFTKFMAKKAEKTSREYRNKFGEYESFIYGELYNYKEVKSNNLEEKMVEMFKRFWDALGKLFVRNQILWFTNKTFISFKDFFIVKMNLYFIGGLMIIYDALDLPTLLIFMNYYSSFFDSISCVMDYKIQFTGEETKIERVFDILEYEVESFEHREIASNDISLSNVSFKYHDEDEYVLRNVSMEIEQNEYVAFVGKSGCGKTTLINLIYRMFEPTDGEITFGGINVDLIDPEIYGEKVSVVLQEPTFFNKSIRYNLLLAKDDSTDDELYDVLEKVNLASFVKGLPEQLDSKIGENGVKLSGGQRQRLALARALLRNTDILILDEATSALDSKNEASLLKIINEFHHKKTIISISHRLSTVCGADRIYVMDQGEIISVGNHSMLKENCDLYKSLFQKQFNEVAINANT